MDILEILIDVCVDTLKLLPFLFLIYLLMEYIEHKAGEKEKNMIAKAEKTGPLWGALVGVIPQCGFSAMSSTLFSSGMITCGTLLAVFLSTSDEMLPILISQTAPASTILLVLGAKVLMGMATGFLVDGVLRLFRKKEYGGAGFHELCEREGCGCEEDQDHGILKPAVIHTLKITAFVFAVTLAVSFLVELWGKDAIAEFLTGIPVLSVILSALVGLIPNCAASVLLTQLYLEGILSAGSFIAGLLTASGVGLLVLFRTNKRQKENLGMILVLYVSGVLWGLLVNALGIVF